MFLSISPAQVWENCLGPVRLLSIISGAVSLILTQFPSLNLHRATHDIHSLDQLWIHPRDSIAFLKDSAFFQVHIHPTRCPQWELDIQRGCQEAKRLQTDQTCSVHGHALCFCFYKSQDQLCPWVLSFFFHIIIFLLSLLTRIKIGQQFFSEKNRVEVK